MKIHHIDSAVGSWFPLDRYRQSEKLVFHLSIVSLIKC